VDVVPGSIPGTDLFVPGGFRQLHQGAMSLTILLGGEMNEWLVVDAMMILINEVKNK
jgi:hypothetical protein